MEDEIDVVLICGSHRYPCHRQILSKHSPYFKAMFSSPMLESSMDEITLKDVTPSALKTLIDYAYTRKFQATNRTVHSVLEAASMFHFNTIQYSCIEYLLANLTIKNCLSVMCCADRLGIPQLLQASRQMVLWEFSNVVCGKEFLQLEAPGVEFYLSDDNLRLTNEKQIFDAILKWIENDPQTRCKYLLKLIKTIRFKQISISELSEMLRNERIKNDHECSSMLTCIRKLKMSDGKRKRCLDDETRNEIAFKLLKTEERILPLVPAVISRGSEDQEKSIVSYFDAKKKEMLTLCELNKVMSNGHVATGFRACVVGERIYLMGGEFYLGCSNWNETMWSLDTFRSSWQFETKLPTKRRHQCVCVLDRHIYLIGGIGQFRVVLDKVERFDVDEKTWQRLASIPTPSYASACTSHRNKIYLLTNQVNCYDPKVDAWTTLRRSELPNEYGFHAALSHGNGIYLVGQHSRNLTLYFTDCKDRGDDKKAYAVVGSFSHTTNNACIVGNSVYSFGCDEEETMVVEVYDIVRKEFQVLCGGSDIKAPLLSNGCFPLPMYQ